MRGSVIAVVIALAAPVSLAAHEGHAHKLTGTVVAVHADMNHVELETADGKTSGFYVTSATRYRKGTKAASLTDLAAGTRVVVTTTMQGDKATASEVRIGAAAAAKATPSAKASPHHH